MGLCCWLFVLSHNDRSLLQKCVLALWFTIKWMHKAVMYEYIKTSVVLKYACSSVFSKHYLIVDCLSIAESSLLPLWLINYLFFKLIPSSSKASSLLPSPYSVPVLPLSHCLSPLSLIPWGLTVGVSLCNIGIPSEKQMGDGHFRSKAGWVFIYSFTQYIQNSICLYCMMLSFFLI